MSCCTASSSSQLLQDWPAFLRDPVSKIDAYLRSNAVNSQTILGHHARLSQLISCQATAEQLSAIPSFNDVDRLANKSLVRFTCMVQDMFDPEFYLALFETRDRATGLHGTGFGVYRDSFGDAADQEVDYESNRNSLQDRMTYLCIAIPGENDWVREKRCAITVEPMDSCTDVTACTSVSKDVGHASAASPGEGSVKRVKLDKEGVARIRSDLNQCFPTIDSQGKKVAFVKVYDCGRDSGLKLNDVIEVVGVLDVGEDAEAVSDEAGSSMKAAGVESSVELNENSFSLPAFVAPRIHALCVRQMRHVNPLVDAGVSVKPSSESAETAAQAVEHQQFCERMRRELHAVLSLCLFGDELAAEYLICCLISRIHSRNEMMTLGSLPIGFSNVPCRSQPQLKEYMKILYQLLSSLVTHSVYLPMSLERLNARSFLPKKDMASNKLVSGQLQLAPETLLFVDETALDAGKLEQCGLQNLKALGELMKWQQLTYDFEYHTMQVDTDMKIMVFSEGKSLLPLNFRIPLEVR